VLRIEALLQLSHPLDVCESEPPRLVFLKTGSLGFVFGQVEALGTSDPEALDETLVPQDRALDAAAVPLNTKSGQIRD
jgi:hypothetical protein